MQLFNGDCLNVMQQIPDRSIDMILCDLPYGTTHANGTPTFRLMNSGIVTDASSNQIAQSVCSVLNHSAVRCACVNTNRDFIGIELDKHYFKIAKQRIESILTKQPEP